MPTTYSIYMLREETINVDNERSRSSLEVREITHTKHLINALYTNKIQPREQLDYMQFCNSYVFLDLALMSYIGMMMSLQAI